MLYGARKTGSFTRISRYRKPGSKSPLKCQKCGLAKLATCFYARAKGAQYNGERTGLCKMCHVSFRRKTNRALKEKLVAMLGGVCRRCRRKVHPAAFNFHHANPTTKRFGLTNLSGRKWSMVLLEARKCELMCSVCHATHHAELAGWVRG